MKYKVALIRMTHAIVDVEAESMEEALTSVEKEPEQYLTTTDNKDTKYNVDLDACLALNKALSWNGFKDLLEGLLRN